MKRALTLCLAGCLAGFGAARAAAEPLEVGGWLGPRLFSDNSRLGQRDVSTPGVLTSALELGGRIGLPIYRGVLVPEAELAFAITQTDPYDVGVFWFEPRVLLRYQFSPHSWLRPFALIGAGAPVGLSGNTDVFANHILGEGFLGGGLAISTGKGFTLRVDARLALLPGDDPSVAVEGEIGVGVSIPIGKGARASRATVEVAAADRDGDGIVDGKDACPARPEDKDGVEDDDGCPDIDNDMDRVLDIADACALQPEVYNGVEDDDGCPDSVAPELAAVVGPIAGLTFAPGAVSPTSSNAATAAFDRIAKVLLAHPTVRIRVVGHTDDREALPASDGIELEGEEPAAGAPDPATLASDLGLNRAAQVRDLMIARGIPRTRIVADSRGAEEPNGDNASNAGRAANRRVELQLVVPQR
jgi:outer membrane protein OmpA-like peptidoglycan-associated protein